MRTAIALLVASLAWSAEPAGAGLYMQGKFAEARKSLESELARRAATPQTHFWLGYTYLALSARDLAVQQFELYLKTNPKDEDVLYALARTYSELGRMSLERIFTLDPNSARAYQMRGVRHELEQNWEAALRQYEKAGELDPKIRGVYKSMGRIYERELKDPEKAKAAYAREPAPLKLPTTPALRGIDFVERGQPARALPDLLRWRIAESSNPGPYFYLGEAFTDLKVRTIQRLRDANPASYRLHQILGENYASLHRKQDAVAEFRKVLELQPKVPGVRYELARLISDSAPEEAKELLRQELEIDPHHYLAKSLLGQIYVALRETDRGLKLLEEVVAARPNLADAQKALGKALLDLKNPSMALVYLLPASELNPDDDQVFFLLSQTYRQLDRAEDADQAMKRHQDNLRRLTGR